jgi:hypothetical protein
MGKQKIHTTQYNISRLGRELLIPIFAANYLSFTSPDFPLDTETTNIIYTGNFCPGHNFSFSGF